MTEIVRCDFLLQYSLDGTDWRPQNRRLFFQDGLDFKTCRGMPSVPWPAFGLFVKRMNPSSSYALSARSDPSNPRRRLDVYVSGYCRSLNREAAPCRTPRLTRWNMAGRETEMQATDISTTYQYIGVTNDPKLAW